MGGIPGERPFNLLLPGPLQPNFIDPLAKQCHWETFAVTGGDGLFLMAEQRPSHIFGAASGAQSVLCPMS